MSLTTADKMNEHFPDVGGGADWSCGAWHLWGDAPYGLLALDNESEQLTLIYSYPYPSDEAFERFGSAAVWIDLASEMEAEVIIAMKDSFESLAFTGAVMLKNRNDHPDDD